MVLDVEASRSIRQAEVGSVRTMIDRASDTLGVKPERLIADTAYGKGEMLDWLVQQRGIAPHIPVIDKSGRKDDTFERAHFAYDAEKDIYTCPGGKALKQTRQAFTEPRAQKPDEDGMLRHWTYPRFLSGFLRAILAITQTGYGRDTQRRVQA